jgi:uncharacterized repeat protein (TIGR03803 family)
MSTMRLSLAGLFGVSLALCAGGHASASTYNVLYSFCSKGGKFVCSDGKNPAAALISDPRGNLYGTTSAGGTTQSGVIFELHRGLNKYSYHVLHSFNCAETCSEGGVPVTPLIIDTKGNLYGTAVSGGSDFGGTVFELSPDRQNKTWTYKVLINFCSQAGTGCLDGMVPQSGLTYAGASTGALYDGTSPLFGTTIEGGSSPGIVYELTQSGGNWTGTTLYGFCHQANCSDGTTPIGQIAVDVLGKTLYGTTNGGGNENGSGVAYKVDIATGAETVLHTFCSEAGCTDGSGGNGGVTLGDRNAVLGTTPLGGANNGGTFFQINAKTGKEKVIYSFCKETDCADGQAPDAALVPNGANLIGTSSGGSVFNGVLFQVNPDKSETVLHTFCQLADCTDGSLPVGALVDPAGTIFGVTEHGGKRNDGVVYQLTALH